MLALAQLDHPRPVDPLNAEWVTIVLLAVFALLAMTNLSSPRKWRLLAHAMFRMRLGRQALREEVDLQDRTLIGLLLAAAGIAALFTWQAMVHTGGGVEVPSYLALVGLFAGGVLAQGLLLRSLSGLLQVDHGLDEFLYTGILLFILLGAVLLPLTVLIAYQVEWRSTALVVGAIAVGLLFLYRWVRGVWIGVGEGVPFRHILFYLCAAEILPVLLLLRAYRHPITPLLNP
ncbi:MAG: DUF4271 domain-containing protein [Flavobacteriales bacterium]